MSRNNRRAGDELRQASAWVPLNALALHGRDLELPRAVNLRSDIQRWKKRTARPHYNHVPQRFKAGAVIVTTQMSL